MTHDEKIEKLTVMKNLLDMFFECEEERVTGWDLTAYKYSIQVEGGYIEIRICFAVNEVISYVGGKVNGILLSFDIYKCVLKISEEHISFGMNGLYMGFQIKRGE